MTHLSFAQQAYRRVVNFEWEPIPGASSYEIELQPKNSNALPFTFKTIKSIWNGRLTPGYYMMRLRAYNQAQTPGPWSPPSEFNVLLDKVKYQIPTQGTEIKFVNSTQIKFQWQNVEGATSYRIEIFDNTQTMVRTQISETNAAEVDLIPGKKYSYKITAISKEKLESESADTYEFTIAGRKLSPPIVNRPNVYVVKEITWSEDPYTQITTGVLSYYNSKTKEWIKVSDYNNLKDKKLNFPQVSQEGIYKLSLQSHADLFDSSDVTSLKFNYLFKEPNLEKKEKEETPPPSTTVSAKTATTPNSNKNKKWLMVASYFISMVNYKGNFDENGSLSYEALGGTGRLGLGYFEKESGWGNYTVIDLSGFIIDNKNITYSSLEYHKVHRSEPFGNFKSILSLGAYFREIPETIADDITQTQDIQINKNSVLGAHAGAALRYKSHPKLGFEGNFRLYYPAFGIHITDNNKLIPELSWQTALLGSYDLFPNITGYAGLTLRKDLHKYKFSNSRDNQIDINGTYLNLMLEVNF